ncbi:hypothetical protein BJ085DRAFT_19628, partial [Dimargaris cristalligena]
GACGQVRGAHELVAGVGPSHYGHQANPNHAPICGRYLVVEGSRGSVRVQISDKCDGCGPNDLLISPKAFEAISEIHLGVANIKWHFEDSSSEHHHQQQQTGLAH